MSQRCRDIFIAEEQYCTYSWNWSLYLGHYICTINTTFHLEHPVLWCSNYLVNDNKILKGIRNDGIPDPSSPSWTTQWSEATLGRVSALSWAAAIDTNKCAPASSQSSVVLLLISLYTTTEEHLVCHYSPLIMLIIFDKVYVEKAESILYPCRLSLLIWGLECHEWGKNYFPWRISSAWWYWLGLHWRVWCGVGVTAGEGDIFISATTIMKYGR